MGEIASLRFWVVDDDWGWVLGGARLFFEMSFGEGTRLCGNGRSFESWELEGRVDEWGECDNNRQAEQSLAVTVCLKDTF